MCFPDKYLFAGEYNANTQSQLFFSDITILKLVVIGSLVQGLDLFEKFLSKLWVYK
jgi:hypothetical protein